MSLTADEQAAKTAGYNMPEGTSLLTNGDDAIRHNAVNSHKLILNHRHDEYRFRGKLPATDLDTMTMPESNGIWQLESGTTYQNAPFPAGTLKVSTSGFAGVQHVSEPNGAVRMRIMRFLAGVRSWGSWFDPTPKTTDLAPLHARDDALADDLAAAETSWTAQLADLDAQLQAQLDGLASAYDVAVAEGYPGTRAQFLDSLVGDRGPEGPAGGTAVTDPQVADMITSQTATRAALTSELVERHGRRGETRTLYVRATGDDANNGSTELAAFREIRAAVASLDAEAPELRGSVVIDVGPGTYKGGIRPPVTRGALQDDFLTIRGPAAGHPNVPTAIIDHAADPAATYGIQTLNGWWLWVEDLKITGPFSTGLDARSGCTLQRRNVHIDGAAIGVNVTGYVSDNAFGGIIENCTTYGVQEMYNVTRTYGGGAGQGAIFRNNPYGIYSKSNCFGHLDDAVFEGNDVAIHLDGGRANLLRVAISASSIVGISLKDSEIHNDGGITWGAGNTRRVLAYGPATTESDVWGWGNDPQATLRDGLRPLLMLGHNYTSSVVTGTTANTIVANFVGVLPADRFAVEGKKMRVKVNGHLTGSTGNPASLAAAIYINLQVGGSQMIAVPIPAGTPSGEFVAEVEMTCLADGGQLYFTGTYITKGKGAAAFNVLRTKDLTATDSTVTVRVQPYDAADTLTVQMVEVYG